MAALMFAGLLALPLATGLWLARRGAWVSARTIGMALALPPILLAGQVLFGSAHMCREQVGWAPYLVPAACGVLLLAFQAPGRARLWTTLGMIAAGLAIQGLALHLVHGPVYTNWDRGEAWMTGDIEDQRQFLVREGIRAPREVREGFAEDQLPGCWDPGEPVALRFEQVPEWHTWLTSLHRRRSTPLGIWLPAGRLADVAARAEWRERTPG